VTQHADARERRKGLIAIGVVTVIWGLNFVLAHPVAVAADPFAMTFIRAVVAAVVFLPIALLKGQRHLLTAKNLLAALPLAVACILFNQVLFLLATRHTTPTHVAVIVATIPVWVALVAWLFLGERLARRRVLGIALAFVGVTVMALARHQGGTSHPSPHGDMLAVLAAASFAAFTVGNKALVGRVGAFAATALVYLVGTVVLLPFAWKGLSSGDLLRLTTSELLSAAYVVVASTLIAYPLFSYALSRLTASRVAVFTYLQPTLAATLSFALGWERFPPATLAGAGMAVLGVVLAQKRAQATVESAPLVETIEAQAEAPGL